MGFLTLGVYNTVDVIYWGCTGKTLYQSFIQEKRQETAKVSEQTETLPTIYGAKNESAYNSTIPLVLGKTLFSPRFCGKPYTTVEGNYGEELYYHIGLLCGYSYDDSLDVSKIRFGKIDVATCNSWINEAQYGKRFPQIDSLHPSIAEEVKSTTDYTQNGIQIEIVEGDKESIIYPQKVTDEQLGIQLINANGSAITLDRFTDSYPMKFEVQLSAPALLEYDNNNNPQSVSLTVDAEYSLDGETYLPLRFTHAGGSGKSNTFRENRNKEMRFIASKTFTFEELFEQVDGEWVSKLADKVVYIRLKKTTADSTKNTVQDKIYLTSIRTWAYDPDETKAQGQLVVKRPIDAKRRDVSKRMYLKIHATSGLKDLVNYVNCMVQAKARTWNGTEWSDEISATSNPASMALMAKQHQMLTDRKIADNKIDFDALGELYEFCEEKGFECNGVYISQAKMSNILDAIYSTCRSYRTLRNGKYSVFVDKRQGLPLLVLNNHNILADGLSNSKEFRDPIHGIKVQFVNEDIGYVQDEIYVMGDNPVTHTRYNPKDPDLNIVTMKLTYVTSPKQAWLLGRFELAKYSLRPETWNRPCGSEAELFDVGDVISLQDDTIAVGLGDGGEVIDITKDDSGRIIAFTTDTKLEISDVTKAYAVKVTHADGVSVPSVNVLPLDFTEPQVTNYFVLDAPTTDDYIGVGDIVSFGEAGKVSTDVLCLGKRKDGEGKYTATLMPYSEEIFDLDDNDQAEIPQFNSNISDTQGFVLKETPSAIYPSIDDVMSLVKVPELSVQFNLRLSTSAIKVAEGGMVTPDSIVCYGTMTTIENRGGDIGDATTEPFPCLFKVVDVDGNVLAKSGELATIWTFGTSVLNGKDGCTVRMFRRIVVDGVTKDAEVDSQSIVTTSDNAGLQIILTNESCSYNCDETGQVSENFVAETEVKVYKGVEEITDFQIEYLPYDENFIIQFVNNERKKLRIINKKGISMPDYGNIEISVVVDSAVDDTFLVGDDEGVIGQKNYTETDISRSTFQFDMLIGQRKYNENSIRRTVYFTYFKNKVYDGKNIGQSNTLPADKEDKDWFVASETFTVGEKEYVKGHIYKYNGAFDIWKEVSLEDGNNYKEIISSVKDLAENESEDDVYFNNVFVKELFAMKAVIKELQSKVISLENGGLIKSSNFDESSYRVDEEGNRIINFDTPIGEGFAFDTYGNARMGGKTEARDFSLMVDSGNVYVSDFSFSMSVESGMGVRRLERVIHIPVNGKMKVRFYAFATIINSQSSYNGGLTVNIRGRKKDKSYVQIFSKEIDNVLGQKNYDDLYEEEYDFGGDNGIVYIEAEVSVKGTQGAYFDGNIKFGITERNSTVVNSLMQWTNRLETAIY